MSDCLWTASDAAKATHGQTRGDWRASGVSIDSRTLRPGDLFVAIKGPNFDGHVFVDKAFAAGAAAAMVSGIPAAEGMALLVGDTLTGLEDLGRAGRARSRARVIGVTGSVGKTGVKEALGQLLSRQSETHYSCGSFNNHFGVPLSLARLPETAVYAVFELGMNHAGEIGPLARMVRPDVAVITTIAPAHLAHFASLADIARAKAEIFEGMAERGIAVLNRDSDQYALLAQCAADAGVKRVIGFGWHAEADFRLLKYNGDGQGGEVRAAFDGHRIDYRLNLPGRHWAENSLAVLAAIHSAGADMFEAARAFRELEPPSGRGRRFRIDTGVLEFLLIDDAYNANPASMLAALEVLAAASPEPGGRRVAVLADMLELGTAAPELHRGLAKPIADFGIDRVYTSGPLMADLFAELQPDRRGRWAETAEDLLPLVQDELRAGDVVLVKGSAGSRAAVIAQGLKDMDRGGDARRREAN